jgi:hypothetical protein
MSSLSGSTVGGDKISEGSEKGATVLEMMPSASQKRGRPKGSRNKKTLEALTTAAAVAPFASAATQTARVPGDAGVPEKWGLGRPKGSGRKPCPQRQPLLRRPAAADGHRAARTRRPLLASGPLPPTRRGPTQWPFLQMVHRGSGRRNRHSSRRPTFRPRGGPPA